MSLGPFPQLHLHFNLLDLVYLYHTIKTPFIKVTSDLFVAKFHVHILVLKLLNYWQHCLPSYSRKCFLYLSDVLIVLLSWLFPLPLQGVLSQPFWMNPILYLFFNCWYSQASALVPVFFSLNISLTQQEWYPFLLLHLSSVSWWLPTLTTKSWSNFSYPDLRRYPFSVCLCLCSNYNLISR